MYTGTWNDCREPWPQEAERSNPAMLLGREIEVDAATPSKDGLIGGARPMFLSIEYLVEAGAVSPIVKVITAAGGAHATWSDDTPVEGYTVRQAILSATPGTKVTLQATNAMARLRWCELVCC